MRIKTKIHGETLLAISIYLLILYLCLPFAMVFLNSLLIRTIVVLSAVFFVLGLVILKKWKYLLLFTFLFLLTVVFWRITWCVQLDTVTYVYYCFASLSFVFSGMALYSSKNIKLITHLFFFLTSIYLITAITSIIGLLRYPLAAREMARGSTYDTSLDFTAYKNMYRKLNIASWSQVYGMIFAVPTGLMLWKKRKKPIFLLLCVAVFLMTVASQITFAVLVSVIMFALVFIFRGKGIRSAVIVFFVLAFTALFLLNMEYILTAAVNMADKAGLDFLTTKLDDLKTLLLYKNAVGDADSRVELYMKSVNTFIAHPMVGLLTSGKASLDSIGYHSDMFDLLGTFGMFGFIVIISSFIGYYCYLRKKKEDTCKELKIMFLGFITLFILNPALNSPQIFMGAFLYPVLASRYCFIKSKECKSELCSLI